MREGAPGERKEAVDLLDVEHCVALEKGDLTLDFLALVVGVRAGEAVGIDDRGTVLALSTSAELTSTTTLCASNSTVRISLDTPFCPMRST